MRQIIQINDYTRELAFEALRNVPNGFVMEIRHGDRTSQQNRFYWALLRDISEQLRPQKVMYDADTWHEYFKTKYLIPKMFKLPNGKYKEVERTTTELTKVEFAEYIEQVLAFATEHGLVWSEEMIREFNAN